MQQAIESLGATIELASRQGSAQARISLQPEELGSVRIHLTQTAAGITARVTAATAAGAQAIASGQSNLKGALSSLGVALLSLDIGSFDGSQAHSGDGSQQRSKGAPGRTSTGRIDAVSGASDSTSTPTIRSRVGALVDVLA